jgi:hypothetical protein
MLLLLYLYFLDNPRIYKCILTSVFKGFNILLAGSKILLFFIHTFVSRPVYVKVIMNCELGMKSKMQSKSLPHST